MISLGAIRPSEEAPGPQGANPGGETDDPAATGESADQRGDMSRTARLDPVAFCDQFLRSNLRLLGGWLVTWIGGFVGMIGSTVICLSFVGEGSWWQPVTMLSVILAWLTLEGYVIAPMVYGRAVRFDPIMVLVAILFFGWLWGPLGMVTALLVIVMLRELAIMSPETPALDALMEPQQSATATTAHASHS